MTASGQSVSISPTRLGPIIIGSFASLFVIVASTILYWGYSADTNEFARLQTIGSMMQGAGTVVAFIWVAASTWYQSDAISRQAAAIAQQVMATEIQQQQLLIEIQNSELSYVVALAPLIAARLDRLAKEIIFQMDENSALDPNVQNDNSHYIKRILEEPSLNDGLDLAITKNRYFQKTIEAYVDSFEQFKLLALGNSQASETKTMLFETLVRANSTHALYARFVDLLGNSKSLS